MIKEKEIIINGHSSNYKYYQDLGYDVQIRKPCSIKTEDLMRGSALKITTICSNCYSESRNAFKDYYIYTNGLVYPFYCIKCKYIKSEKTCIEKYGVKNPMQTDQCKETLRKSLSEKYGVDHYSKTDEYKVKFKKTCTDKYGVDNPFKSEEVKNKIKETNNDRIGVDYPMQSEIVQNKSKETCTYKYGVDSYTKTEEYLDKVIKTNIERYGVSHSSSLESTKEMVKITNNERYGSDFYTKTDKFKTELREKRERFTLKRFIDLLLDEYEVISYSNEVFKMIHTECLHEFETYKGLVISRKRLGVCICTKCNPVGLQYSSIESEIHKLLDDNNIEYLKSDRKILNGKEIDIFIPKYNVGIEVNGVFWHSELYKPTNYHREKTEICQEFGIDLMHIWEDDWKTKKDIVKSIILSRVNSTQNKLYARSCEILDVSSSDARKFLDENHIQGFSSSSFRTGLYYKEDLVSLMTFGFRYTNGKKEFELIRFCNKVGYSVIGSASKLFTNFIKTYKFEEVVSYADISIFGGNVYKTLGFDNINLSDVNYFWVVNGIRKHRYNYSKKKLVREGFDPLKTEVEIMHERGFYRIFGCGHQKWIWAKKEL